MKKFNDVFLPIISIFFVIVVIWAIFIAAEITNKEIMSMLCIMASVNIYCFMQIIENKKH
jgi:hypothetical protein